MSLLPLRALSLFSLGQGPSLGSRILKSTDNLPFPIVFRSLGHALQVFDSSISSIFV
jgi:hypothetical protein